MFCICFIHLKPRRWSSVDPLTHAWSTWTLSVCSPVWACGCSSGCLGRCCWSEGSSSLPTNSGWSSLIEAKGSIPFMSVFFLNSVYQILKDCTLKVIIALFMEDADIRWKSHVCFHHSVIRNVGGPEPHFKYIKLNPWLHARDIVWVQPAVEMLCCGQFVCFS